MAGSGSRQHCCAVLKLLFSRMLVYAGFVHATCLVGPWLAIRIRWLRAPLLMLTAASFFIDALNVLDRS